MCSKSAPHDVDGLEDDLRDVFEISVFRRTCSSWRTWEWMRIASLLPGREFCQVRDDWNSNGPLIWCHNTHIFQLLTFGQFHPCSVTVVLLIFFGLELFLFLQMVRAKSIRLALITTTK